MLVKLTPGWIIFKGVKLFRDGIKVLTAEGVCEEDLGFDAAT